MVVHGPFEGVTRLDVETEKLVFEPVNGLGLLRPVQEPKQKRAGVAAHIISMQQIVAANRMVEVIPLGLIKQEVYDSAAQDVRSIPSLQRKSFRSSRGRFWPCPLLDWPQWASLLTTKVAGVLPPYYPERSHWPAK